MPDTSNYSSDRYVESLHKYKKDIDAQLENFKQTDFLQKFFNFNYLLWSDNPEEITNRLGWLYIPFVMQDLVFEIKAFADEIKSEGFKDILLLGMGGSSLSSDVFKDVFGVGKGYPNITIVDTTDPDFLSDLRDKIDISKTLIIVSTKSGGTVETLSAMKLFYNEFKSVDAGNHFVGITDPGSKLLKIAEDLNFRRVFVNDPNIGGRFSVLSYFGLVPAALIGVNIEKILLSATQLCDEIKNPASNYLENASLRLGAVMGVLSRMGRDKLTFIFSEKFYSFGYWAEQLIAESTGKDGKGILPVMDQKNFSKKHLSDDRFFIAFIMSGDKGSENLISDLNSLGQPVVKILINDIYELGAEFFRFEFATSVAGSILGINPFDQPDVESAKIMAREFLEELASSKKVGTKKPDFLDNGLSFYTNLQVNSVENLQEQLQQNDNSYISIHAYINPDPINQEKLMELRDKLEDKTKLPVTLGFGPRFLHSTGQLHKGDNGKGFFIQLVGENKNDFRIPDSPGSDESSLSFGVLKKAQAAGDYKALSSNKRNVVSIHFSDDPQSEIQKIIDVF